MRSVTKQLTTRQWTGIPDETNAGKARMSGDVGVPGHSAELGSGPALPNSVAAQARKSRLLHRRVRFKMRVKKNRHSVRFFRCFLGQFWASVIPRSSLVDAHIHPSSVQLMQNAGVLPQRSDNMPNRAVPMPASD